MASIARQTTQRLVSSGISAPRALSTSAVASAAAKGKPAKGSAPSKKAQQGFSKKQPAKAGGGGSGGGGSGSKSITLRYENALPAPDLSDLPLLHPETVIASNVGTAAIIPSEALEKIKAFGLPRRLDKELARGPAVIVVRDQTIDIAKRIDGVKQSSSATGAQETIILAGEQGTGKSTILLQSVTHALNSGWLVLYIPKASEWISSSSPYMYNTTTQQFSQPALASALLDKLIKVNSDALAKVTTDEGKSVLEVAKRGVGVDAGEASVEILRKVMAALGKQSEVPVMIAIDEIQALFSKSEYLTPTGGAVESYHLSTPRLFLDYLTGRETLQSGLILTALSQSTPSLPISPTLAHALSLPTTRAITPYTELHPHHLAHAQAVLGPSPASLASASAGAGDKADEKGKSTGKGKGEVVEVKGYTPKEAAGVFGILARLGRTGAGGVGRPFSFLVLPVPEQVPEHVQANYVDKNVQLMQQETKRTSRQ